GAELVAARAPGDGFRPPEGGLDVDVGGVQGDGRGFAAHDARQALDLVAGDHHPDLGVELDRLAVEQLEGLAFAGPAHFDVDTDLVQVEHVRRAAQFEHDVVGDIDQRRHRALPCPFEPGFHPD